MKFFKLIIIYIVIFVFLIVPLSYSKDKICIVKEGSTITATAQDMVWFMLFTEWGELELIKFMVYTKRFIPTKKDLKVIILDIIKDEKNGLDMFKVRLKNNKNISFWVLYYNIKCDKEKNNKELENKKPTVKT